MSIKYVKAWQEYIEYKKPTFLEDDFANGWLACKAAVLEILNQPIQNADLSWEEVDKRFIEKIEKL